MNKKVIFIWGTGAVADWIISQYEILEQYDIKGFIDNDIRKIGKPYKNYMVYSPEILKKEIPDKIVILSNFYFEIKKQIIKSFPYMEKIIENKYYFIKEMIINRYKNSDDNEIKNILEYLKENDLDIFNYEFKNQYKKLKINVEFDEKCGLFFVYHQNKKMYFARKYDTKDKVKEYYRSLLVEQDVNSPHRYLTHQFDVEEGDVVIDVGVAEGNFSLEIIEKASKVYLIETDDEWIEAIKETFKEYQEKVVIIKKFITSMSVGKYMTLDSLINEPINFIKMDIEGNEWDALLGAERIFEISNSLKCAICIYHHNFDEILVKDVMDRYGVSCSTTKGYMWYPLGEGQTHMSTKLCRGILRGIK